MTVEMWTVRCDHDRCPATLESEPGHVKEDGNRRGWLILSRPLSQYCPDHRSKHEADYPALEDS